MAPSDPGPNAPQPSGPRHDPVPSRTPLAERRLDQGWPHFRRMMAWMVLAAALVTGGALLWLWVEGALVSIHAAIAAALGVFLSVMLGTGLMLLVFMSHGTGHDDDVAGGI